MREVRRRVNGVEATTAWSVDTSRLGDGVKRDAARARGGFVVVLLVGSQSFFLDDGRLVLQRRLPNNFGLQRLHMSRRTVMCPR